MIPIKEYLSLCKGRRLAAGDVLLRQLPEAIARWRSEQQLPQGRLKEEFIKVDAETGYVEIEPVEATDAAAESDDVKDYGAIVANLLETSMPPRRTPGGTFCRCLLPWGIRDDWRRDACRGAAQVGRHLLVACGNYCSAACPSRFPEPVMQKKRNDGLRFANYS